MPNRLPAPEAVRVRMLHGMLGMNQTELAAWVGVPIRRWNNYARGKPMPRTTVFLVYQKLGLSVDWLYFGLEGNLNNEWRERIAHANNKKSPTP